MSERLSIVIPSELNEEIEKIQKILKMDNSTVIRHLLLKSIQEVKIETALEEYNKGKISFRKASELAGINLWEFIELFHERKISLNITSEEAEDYIKKINRLDLSKYT